MFKPLEVYIGLRYVRAKRRNHFISFISLFSIIGIALGILVLITVLSVMNGFQKEVLARNLAMAAHASVEGLGEPLRDWPVIAERAQTHERVRGAAPYVEGQAMVTMGEQSQGVVLRGILPDEEPKVSEVQARIISGSYDSLQAGEFNILLGSELALKLLGTNDLEHLPESARRITVIVPQTTVTPAGILPRYKRFVVTGIFEIGMFEFDSGLAVIHLQDAAKLYRLDDAVSGVRLKVDDMMNAPLVARELVETLPNGYIIQDWTRKYQNLFSAIQFEKRMMFLILLLIVAVAAFNIVTTLVMVVTDKKADIAILRTLGLSPQSVMSIFIIQGCFIGFLGTLLGLIAGLPFAYNVNAIVSQIESWTGRKILSPDVYYISEITADVRWEDVTLVCASALIITLVATLYPAWRAARTQPAEALRYE